MDEVRQNILKRIQKEVPCSPGVYLFKNQQAAIIYIGKSVNLRQRMSSYLRKPRTLPDDRIRRMALNIRDFDFRETESELLALLLENELIKTHMPYFNVRQKEFPNYQYLVLTEDPFPTLRITDHTNKDEYRYIFGPFRDHFFADRVVNIIYPYIRIRSCPPPTPSGPCLNHEIGLCIGPCSGEISEHDYKKVVADVKNFLHGNMDYLHEKLETAMNLAAKSQDFEKAARIRDQIDFCEQFSLRQRFIHAFKTQNLVIHEDKASSHTHIFVKGKGESYNGQLDQKTIRDIITTQQVLDLRTEDERFILDRANILYSWIKGNKSEFEFISS